MAEHKRIASGLLSDTSQQETWSGSAWGASAGLPLAGDTLHANGFNTVLDVDLLDVDIKNNVNFNGTAVSGMFEILSAGITYRGTRYASTNAARPVLFVSFGGGVSYVLGGAEISLLYNSGALVPSHCGLLINGQAGGRVFLETTGNAIGTLAGRSVEANGAGNGFVIECVDIFGSTGAASSGRWRAGLAVLGDGYKVIATNITPGDSLTGGAMLITGTGNEVDVDGIVSGCATNNPRSAGISFVPGNIIRINGIAMATQFSPAVVQAGMVQAAGLADYGLSTIELNGVSIDSENYSAIIGASIKIPDTPLDTSWAMKTPTGGDRTLYTAGLLKGYPLPAKVEANTAFGPSSEFTGTLEPWSPAFAAALGNNVGQYITPQVLSAITGLP